MSEQDVIYDAFLSHASEDKAWCTPLAEHLRDAGVRIWFDQWEIKAGDHLLRRLNDGIRQSRKMIAVWSPAYFSDQKTWTLAESYSQQQPDALARERPLIPLLIETCEIPPTFRNLIHIDFRNEDDIDLRFRQLLEALDLPEKGFTKEEAAEFREHELDRAKIGKLAREKGQRFEDEVAKLYQLLGFAVKQNTQLSGVQIDMSIQQKVGGLLTQAIVECKNKRITNAERDQILAQQNLAQRKLPAYRWIAVTSDGFTADARTALEESGIACVTYTELLQELVRLEPYVEHLITDYEAEVTRNWNGDDGKAIRVLEGHTNWVNSVQFSPDGKRLASGSYDQTVRIWNSDDGTCTLVLAGHLGPVNAVQFAPNGKYLVAAGSAGRLQFWGLQKGETFLYRYHFGPGAWLDLLPDGRFNASPEGMRYLCYTEQGTFNSFTAEELVQEFYDPEGVKKVMREYM